MSLKHDFMSIFPNALDEMNINPLTMTFKGHEEKAYWKSRLDKELAQKRVGIVLGVLLYLVFGFADALLMPEVKDLAWFFRFALYIPLAMGVFIATYLPIGKTFFMPMTTGLVALAGLGQIAILVIAPLDVQRMYYMAIVLFAIYGLTILRTSFLYSVSAIGGLFAVFSVYILGFSPFATAERLSALAIVFAGFAIAAASGYFLEYSQRRNYYLTSGRGAVDFSDNKKSTPSNQSKNEEQKPLVRTVESPVNKIFEQLNDMSWFITVDGEIKYISPAVKEFLGYEVDELMGKRAMMLMPNDAYQLFEEQSARLYRDKNKVQGVFDYKTKAGLIKSGEVVMRRYQDKRFGEGYVGSTRAMNEGLTDTTKTKAVFEVEDHLMVSLKGDLEDAKHYNRQLTQEIDDLKYKIMRIQEDQEKKQEVPLDALAEVLERVSLHYAQSTKEHLNSNLKELDLIEDKFKQMSMTKYDLENYLKSSRIQLQHTANGLDVIKDRMLLFKSFLMPKEAMNLARYQMRSILEESVLKLKQFFRSTKHIIEIDCPRDIEMVIDKTLFEQVINNMIIHSLQFSFAKERHGKITIDVVSTGGVVTITYSDNGEKLQGDVIDEMFARMINHDLNILEGLELHLVRQIIEKHLEGSIGCSYAVQKNTFTITLPSRPNGA